jgi:hypothetical protein
MSDWIHALPLGWMAILIFGSTFLIATVIHQLVMALAVGDRARTAVNQEASALRAVVILSDGFPGQAARLRGLIRQHIQAAQREEWPAMASRQRILISQSEVNAIKWISLFIQAICTLTAIAISILLITAHDRPFIGQNAVQPTVLLQVQPDAAVEDTAR